MPQGPKLTRLKKRHELFLTHYLDCFDPGLAAERSGYGAWYAEAHLPAIGRRILRRQDVADACEERLMATLRGYGLSQGAILKGILDIAHSKFDPRRLYRSDGTPCELDELDDETASFIEGIEIEEIFEGRGEHRHKTGEIKKYKIRGRKLSFDALVKLGEHLKLFDGEGAKKKEDQLQELNRMVRMPLEQETKQEVKNETKKRK